MRKVQILIVVALLVLNTVALAWADTTITINGTLDPLVIDITVSPATLDFYLASGETSDVTNLIISNRTPANVEMKVAGFSIEAASPWKPYRMELKGSRNWNTLTVADSDIYAALTLLPSKVDVNWAVPPQYDGYAPLIQDGGTTSSNILMADGANPGDGGCYAANYTDTIIGVIKPGNPDTPTTITIPVEFNAGKLRANSNTLSANMVLGFRLVP